MDGVFKRVAVDFQKTEQMFVETDGLVVVAVEQTFAMQLRLVDQARQMNVSAELFVRTARMQSVASTRIRLRAPVEPRPIGTSDSSLRCGRLGFRQKFTLGQTGLTDDELSGKHSALLDRDRFCGHVSVERTGFVNRYRTGRHDFTRHATFDVDVGHRDAPETLNVRLSFDRRYFERRSGREFCRPDGSSWTLRTEDFRAACLRSPPNGKSRWCC